jgi:hypothetical protein
MELWWFGFISQGRSYYHNSEIYPASDYLHSTSMDPAPQSAYDLYSTPTTSQFKHEDLQDDQLSLSYQPLVFVQTTFVCYVYCDLNFFRIL